MKILALELGGHPFKNDNLDHIQASYTEALGALVEGLSIDDENGFKLYGCEVTYSTTTLANDTANWTAGWIVVDGEILEVEAGGPVVKSAFQGFRWAIQESVPGPDPQSYADGSTPYVHKVRKAVIVAGTLTNLDTLADAPYLKDVIHPNYDEENTGASDWNAEHDINGAVAWTVTSSSYNYRRSNRQLELNIQVLISSLAADANYLDITLPDNLLSAGTFVGTAWISDTPYLVKALPGADYIRVYNNTGVFATGALSLELAIRLEVQM